MHVWFSSPDYITSLTHITKMAVALGLTGAAAVTGMIAAHNAKKEVNAVLENKVQKKIDKKCAELNEEEVWGRFYLCRLLLLRYIIIIIFSLPSTPPFFCSFFLSPFLSLSLLPLLSQLIVA